MFQKMSPYLVALVIGLIIGVERERHRLESPQSMGVRSFFLFALLGAIAAGIEQPLIALSIAIFAGLTVVVGYYRASDLTTEPVEEIGLTTEIAAMATFGLGYLSRAQPLLSLALSVIILFALLSKTKVHAFIATKVKATEIQSAAILLLLGVGVIPLIPEEPLDPLGIFNVHRLAVIIFLIASIQFVGYVASRVLGSRIGLPFAGFLGGIVSSTAVFISHPAIAKAHPKSYLTVGSAAMFAIVATLCQLVILVGAISWQVIIACAIPVAAIILVTVAIAFLLYWKGAAAPETKPQNSPINLWSAIKLGCFLMAIIVVIDLTQRFLGDMSAKLVTFLAGLFELHGVVIAGANMYENKTITLQAAADTVLIAIFASMVSKIFITAFLARDAYRIVMLIIICGLTVLTAGFWLLIRFFPSVLLGV